MLQIIRKRVRLALNEEQAVLLREDLHNRYSSLLVRLRAEVLEGLGLEGPVEEGVLPPRSSPFLLGEVYCPQPGSVIYLKCLRDEGELEVGALVGQGGAWEPYFAGILESLEALVGQRLSWEVPDLEGPLEVEGASPGEVSFEEGTRAAALELLDPVSRALLGQVREAGSIFLNKLEGEDRQGVAARVARFEQLGLLSRDYAVLCRRSGQQILRVADRATIEESSQKAFKCFICGNPISDEVVEEILTAAEGCSALLLDQRWLRVLVGSVLGELGVRQEWIQVHQAPGGAVHLFLEFNHQRFLFVLSTARFTLEQADAVGATLSACQLRDCLFLSSERVSAIMRHHLIRANPGVEFSFVESLDGLEEKIRYVLHEKFRSYIGSLMEGFSALTRVPLGGLILRRLAPPAPPRGDLGGEEPVPSLRSLEPAHEGPFALEVGAGDGLAGAEGWRALDGEGTAFDFVLPPDLEEAVRGADQ